MGTYRVTPLSMGQYDWQVQKNGRRISKHRKKSAAKRMARRKADADDTVLVHRRDGTQM